MDKSKLQHSFEGLHSCKRHHFVCFEKFAGNSMLRNKNFIIFFILNAVIKVPKCIAFSTVRDKITFEYNPTLTSSGRIDLKKVELSNCTKSQFECFVNHSLLCTKPVTTWTPLQLRTDHFQVTPVQVVQLVLANP